MVPATAALGLQIQLGSWPIPPLFDHLARLGKVATAEMRRTFNLGIGMVVAVPPARADDARALLESEGEVVHRIGRVTAAERPGGEVEFVE